MKIKGICSKLLLVGLCLVILTMLTNGMDSENLPSPMNFDLLENARTQISENPFSFDWTPHAPIEIDSDEDFLSLGFNGSGSEFDPYIIEGYNITTTELATSAIFIAETTSYFLIRNCYLESVFWGIYITDVAEDTVRIINTTCCYCIGGIQIIRSPGSTLINNTCSNNSRGITLNDSPNSTLTNSVCNNNEGGLVLDQSSSSTIAFNTFQNNFHYGIQMLDSDSCLISFNLFQKTLYYGLDLDGYSEGNLIHYNTFIENSWYRLTYSDSSSQANDNGKKNEWYETGSNEGNFWSDLGDDCKYLIDGSARSKDLFPLNRAETCPNPYVGSTLAIVLPVLITASILAFVLPKYIIPYVRENDIKKLFVSWFHRIKGVLLGLFIGGLLSAGGFVLFRGLFIYSWAGDGYSSLIGGSIMLAVAIIVFIFWVSMRRRTTKRNKTEIRNE